MADTAFAPDWFSKPGDTLLALMEQHELTAEGLAAKLKCSNLTVYGLIAGTVAIDNSLASALSKHVGGTPKFWESRQTKYQRALSRAAEAVPKSVGAEWIKLFPHADMARNGWINHSRNRDELVKAYLAYFGVNDPTEWEERYADFFKLTAFRTSPTFQSKVGPLSAWLRQGELAAAQVQCRPWDSKQLRKRLGNLRALCKAKNPEYFLPRIRKICAEVGIAVVFVRAPSGCAASGATRFVASNKAMVILSFRYLSDDHFWFTFFHEIGHLLRHSAEMTFVDCEGSVANKMEQEANEFAERILVPEDRQEELTDLKPRRDSIVRFAVSIGMAPGIVVGQLQHHAIIDRSQMNGLKRRYTWEQVASSVR